MRDWSQITFLAAGDVIQIKKLHKNLPKLFHLVIDVDLAAGALTACVARHCAASITIQRMIRHNPDLKFNGVQLEELADDRYWVFTGANGKTEWNEISYPDGYNHRMTTEEMEDEIQHLDEKISWLQYERKCCSDVLREVESRSNDLRNEMTALGGKPTQTVH